ncbi:MAG: single-stranded-DNA-specific exonuclease RecJ [Chlamydiota bacterium]
MTNLSKHQILEWIEPKNDPKWQQAIIHEFNIHPVIAQVLVSRNFKNFADIHAYLYAKLPNLLDPALFIDMEKAVTRIYSALKAKEPVLVFGDNDVDGITGTALLVEFLRYIGIEAHFCMANRNTSTGGILTDAKQYALNHGCKLLITVDCGVTAGHEIAEFVNNGIDVIITDHHEPTAGIPHCIATLNPKLLHNTYPNRDLTGVGVAFKLAHALANDLIKTKEVSSLKVDLKRYLDLAALGTIADMGSLLGENRILVRYGLKQLKKTKRIGLTKLLDVCDVNEQDTTTIDIASKVAPRLNSLGRIADPVKGVDLLLMKDAAAAEALAKELELNNIERQRIERKDSEDIENYIAAHPEILTQKAIVLASPKWHPGIIPILTARISKQYNRPTLIIAIDQGIGKGSLRTIPEFPLLPTLKSNSHLLINFGGHDYAAGLSIDEKNIEAFTANFIEAASHSLKEADLIPKLYLDAKVKFEDLTFDFLESLHLLEPFGTGNSPPILYSEATQIWPPKIVGKIHLKLYLQQNDRVLEGIAFGLGDRRHEICKKNITLKVAFTPYVNNFLNKSSIQLLIKDFKEA